MFHVTRKLNKANAILSKLRPVLDLKTLRSVYYATLHCFGRKTLIQFIQLHLLQKKSLRMFFQSRNFHTGALFQVSNILKYFKKTALEKCIFIRKSLTRLYPFIFNSCFKFSFESHSHDTRWSNLGYLNIPFFQTKTYGRYLMFINAIFVWNYLQSCHENVIFHQLGANIWKEILINFFLNRYN